MPRRAALASCALAVLALVQQSLATGHSHAPIPSRVELMTMLHGLPPGPIDPSFECSWRGLAYNYSISLQPFRPASAFQDIWDSLQLTTLCNQTFVPPQTVPAVASQAIPSNALYVDPVNGNDSNDGSLNKPLKTLAVALIRSRKLPRPGATVVLRGGVHRLSATLQLGAADSGVSFVAYPGETPVISGGAVLRIPSWTPYNITPAAPPTWEAYNNTNGLESWYPSPYAINASVCSDWQCCQQTCQQWPSDSPQGACQQWTWNDETYPAPWTGTCFVITQAGFHPVNESNHWAGRRVNNSGRNVWVADISASGLPAGLAANQNFVPALLFSPDGGATPARGIRARWPDADPELAQYPEGWAPHDSGSYIPAPPVDINSTSVVHVPETEYPGGMFTDYWWGEGGPCVRYEPPSSYWCQPNGRVAGASYFIRTPLGYVAPPSVLPNSPYNATALTSSGGWMNYWREGHWFTMMARIAGYTSSNSTLYYGYGQHQGAEGENSGEDWFVEHILEELDAPREFLLDAPNGRLYFYHNATPGTPPPSDWTFEVPLLPVLVNVSGTSVAPVTDVTFSGITFTGAAPTYMWPHGTPSGGDWGLARVGAVFLQGTERVTITDSLFSRLDGNGLFLSGYNRNATVTRSEFVWIGDSAVASWGFTLGPDGTNGEQPWGTVVSNNICHEIGHFEKQSSCYFQATSALATIEGNVFYNGPRAHVNFNDGFGGSNMMTRNLLWNSCRESQDHGPVNSWSRVPYLTTVRNGTASLVPDYTRIISNFIVAGGGADGGSVDNDDGSSYYLIENNFFVYGGMKSDFDGHAQHSTGNLMAYANVYGPSCVSLMQIPQYGNDGLPYAAGYQNNTCIVAAGGHYLSAGARCANDNSTGTLALWIGGNEVFTPGGAGNVTINWCGKKLAWSDWMALGLDKGSSVQDANSLDTATIISWARELLGF